MAKTQKNDTTNVETLRAQADAAVEAWRTAETAKEEALRSVARFGPGAVKTHEDELAKTLAERRRFEAEDLAWQRQAEAAALLDAADLADGDELATASETTRLHADVVALLSTESDLLRQLAEVQARRVERVARAQSANDALMVRRQSSGLPMPRWSLLLRRLEAQSLSTVGLPIAQHIRAGREPLDKALAMIASPVPIKSYAETYAGLDRRETEIRATIERKRREKEKQEKDRAAAAAWREQKEREQAAEAERNRQTEREKREAEERETRELARRHGRDRSASFTSSLCSGRPTTHRSL